MKRFLISAGLIVAALTLVAATGVSPVQTFSCSASQFVNSLAATGTFDCGQPAFSDVSGAASASQLAGSAASHAVPVDVAGTPTWKVVADCTDTGGNHLNYTQSTDAFSCGTTGPAAAATPLATGTSVSLTAPRGYYVCTGTCTVTPPVPAAGYEFCVVNDDNVATVITLAALGSSARYENTARTAYGTAGTGTFISGGAVGDKVCLVGRDSTHYLTVSFSGTWTAS